MIFSKELEKLAEEHGLAYTCTDSHMQFTVRQHRKDSHLAGAAALENLILKSGDEFDEDKFNEWFLETSHDCNGEEICMPSNTDCARWQHQKDQLIIVTLKEDNEALRRNLRESNDTRFDAIERSGKLQIAVEALKFYAAYPDNEFKTTWQSHVCDSWSGLTDTFDWDGALQDYPFEIARKTLSKLESE